MDSLTYVNMVISAVLVAVSVYVMSIGESVFGALIAIYSVSFFLQAIKNETMCNGEFVSSIRIFGIVIVLKMQKIDIITSSMYGLMKISVKSRSTCILVMTYVLWCAVLTLGEYDEVMTENKEA